MKEYIRIVLKSGEVYPICDNLLTSKNIVTFHVKGQKISKVVTIGKESIKTIVDMRIWNLYTKDEKKELIGNMTIEGEIKV